MKWCILLCIILAVSVANICANNEIIKDMNIQKKIQECYEETKTPSELQQSNLTGLLNDPKLKCFSACMMKKKGTMRDGKINPEKQLLTMPEDSSEGIKEVVNTCAKTANQQGDECEIAHSYVKCLIKNVGVYQG